MIRINTPIFYFLLFILLLTAEKSVAQAELPYGDSTDKNLPEWAREMYKNQPDYGKLIDLHNQYFKTHKLVKNKHTQYYKRLLHDLEQDTYGLRFGLNDPAEIRKIEKEYLRKLKQNQAHKSWSSWTCIGPFDFDIDANSRSYAPGAAHMYTVEQSISNPDVLYAGGATSGVWKTTDKGLHWSLITAGLNFNEVYSLEIDFSNENTVYIGASTGMFKSTDGGISITQIGDPAFQALDHNRFRETTMDPSNNNVLWTTSELGLYKTLDAGNNWTEVMSGYFQEIEFHPTSSSTMYTTRQVDDSTEFFKSTDSGLTWTKKITGWPAPGTQGQPAENKRIELAVSPASPNMVFAYATGEANGGSGTYGVYVSLDQGETWSFKCCGSQPAGPPDEITNPNLMGWSDEGDDDGGQYYYDVGFAVSPTNTDSVFVGGVNMWYSDDGGSNFSCPAKWSHPYKDNYVHADIHDIKIYGTDIWIACDGGLFYSNDGCQNITKQMFGISGTDFWGFGAGFSDGNVMLGGTYHNGTLLKDNDVYINGWASIQGGDNYRGQVNPFDNRIIYDDGGRKLLPGARDQNITSLDYSITPNKTSNLDFHKDYSSVLYSGYNNTLIKSTDGGATSSVVHDFGVSLGIIKVAPSNPDVIVVSTNPGTYDTKNIYRSTDGGASWADITPGSTILDGKVEIPYDFEIDETDPDIIYLARIPRYSWSSWLKDGYKVFKTIDGGANWTNITTADLDGEWIRNIAYQQGTNGGLYLGTRQTVYYKDNLMSNWVLYNSGLPVSTRSLEIVIDYHNERIINATNRGVFVRDFYSASTPSADFGTGSDSVFCIRDTVRYYDHSLVPETGTSWSWTFPGAAYVSSTSVKNPKVIYTSTGTYSASLSITDGSNNTWSKTKTDIVTLLGGCNADSLPGSALLLVSAGDYCKIPDIGLTTNTVTLSAWVKPDGIQNDYSGIVFNDGTSAGLNVREGNNTLAYHWPGGAYWWDSNLEVPPGLWSHVAMVVSPSSITLYLNGQAAIHTVSPDEAVLGTMKIGSYKGWSSRNFKGLIDEVCIYDTILTQQQIRELMHKTKTPESFPSLVHYYQFNETSGDCIDRAGIAHATFSGNASRVSSTAPIPFVTVTDGPWETNNTWDLGQNTPVNAWSRVRIKHNVILNNNMELLEIIIDTNAVMSISPGDTLTVTGNQ